MKTDKITQTYYWANLFRPKEALLLSVHHPHLLQATWKSNKTVKKPNSNTVKSTVTMSLETRLLKSSNNNHPRFLWLQLTCVLKHLFGFYAISKDQSQLLTDMRRVLKTILANPWQLFHKFWQPSKSEIQ